jgi:hypothetical protein
MRKVTDPALIARLDAMEAAAHRGSPNFRPPMSPQIMAGLPDPAAPAAARLSRLDQRLSRDGLAENPGEANGESPPCICRVRFEIGLFSPFHLLKRPAQCLPN